MSYETLVLSQDALHRAITRMAHEIAEKNLSSENVAVIGIQKGGVILSKRVTSELETIWKHSVPSGTIDVSMYRDDLDQRPTHEILPTEVTFDINDKTVLLVDDVLFSGRTIRAAMDALSALGRPKKIQLAVLIDRGYRELPIMPNFVGKQIATTREDHVLVKMNSEGLPEEVTLQSP